MNRAYDGLAQRLTLEHSSYSAMEVVSFGWKDAYYAVSG